jgi:hypothetical protein
LGVKFTIDGNREEHN